MKKLVDLKVLFTVVAAVELTYALLSLTPPSLVEPVTGWVLNADGHWVVKILGMGLFTQAAIAWIFRKQPHLGVAKALAFYQIASATVDWVMWLTLKDEGIFSTALSQMLVPMAIVSHYTIGILLVIGIGRSKQVPTTR
jgi:hypothetical protein